MKKIKVSPFPNFKITDEGYKNSVAENSSDDTKAGSRMLEKAQKKSSPLVVVNTFDSGERRVNFALPVNSSKSSYWAIFPNPIHLYLSQSINQLDISRTVMEKLFPQSSLPLHKNEEIKFLNSNEENTNDSYNLYLQYRVGSIIMLVCALEGFLNFIIPEEFETLDKKGNKIGKIDIQRRFQIKTKIDQILPELGFYNIKTANPKLRNKIIRLISIRNEFVHLKNENKAHLKTDYHKVFINMQKFDIESAIGTVIEFMNLVKPGFIVERE